MKESRTDRTIELGGHEISYVLSRKEVRNINLRIRADGSISVSAHPRVSLRDIEDFMRRKAEFILRAVGRAASDVGSDSLADGSIIRLFDERLTLRVLTGRRSAVRREGDRLIVTLAEGQPADFAEALVERWLAGQCRDVITQLCMTCYRRFEPLGYSFPRLRFRAMTSRWGSCAPGRCSMTFNTALINYPLAAAEYVVLHEFTHLIHPNHSKQFYERVAAVMPDWKARKAMLSAAGRRSDD